MRQDLARTPLLDRLRTAGPAIVAIIAPAGFGKSTLMRQYGGTFPAFAVCDCAAVRSPLDLAGAVIGALGRERPGRGPALAQTAAYLAETSASGADRIEAALAAWKEEAAEAAFVFENAESALGEPAARELFERLLTARPDGRTVVICSRETPRMHLSRFAAPHRIVSVRAADLAFTRDEIDAIFEPLDCDEATREEVAALSAGWPIAVLLLARLAAERRLAPLLDELDDVAFDELYEYLADQVLDATPAAAIDGMLACAAIPRATAHDLQLALDGPRAIESFLAFQKTSPFVARADDGAWIVHPLIAATLLGRHAARADALLERTARAYLIGGAYERVAELELARNDQVAAAEALDRIGPDDDEAPSLGYAQVLFALDRAVVLRYPRLWSVTALLRTFTVDARAQLAEGEAVWGQLGGQTPPSLRAYLTVFRVMLLSYVGDCERGLALIAEFGRHIGLPELPASSLHGWLLQLRALMSARLGRLAEAERDLDTAWPFVSATHLTAAGALLTAGAEIARARGDRAAEREHLEAALARVRAAGLGNFIALHEAEGALGAWLAGDDDACAEHQLALEAEIVRDGARAFAFFAACLRGERCVPEAVDHIKWVACGHLIAAAQAADLADAMRHADAAREAAGIYRAPLYSVLAALAAGELDPARRDAMYAEAAQHARQVASPALHVAVAELRRRAPGGFLTAFAARYHAAREHAQAREICVELVTGRVLRDSAPLPLADRELALLIAVAVRREALSREALTELLWPELAESAARNAFHVCLHRLKTRLGDDGAIVRSGEGYRLGAGVRVDLWEIDRLAASLRAGGASRAAADGAAALYDRLRATRPPKFADWEWFEPTERRLCELRSTLAQLLAGRALDAGRWDDALALCDEMIAYDSCDEPAREIAIRAYLAAGDRPAALRHFRQYRATLMSELGCEPSRGLAELLGADAL